jgi:hypothetical protein
MKRTGFARRLSPVSLVSNDQRRRHFLSAVEPVEIPFATTQEVSRGWPRVLPATSAVEVRSRPPIPIGDGIGVVCTRCSCILDGDDCRRPGLYSSESSLRAGCRARGRRAYPGLGHAARHAIFTAASHTSRALDFIHAASGGGLRRPTTGRGVTAHRIHPLTFCMWSCILL